MSSTTCCSFSHPIGKPSQAQIFDRTRISGLYQTKNGLLVLLGSLRSRKSMTLAEISSSTVFERSSVSGPSSLHLWFCSVPSADLHHSTLRGGVRQVVVLGSAAPGTSGTPGIGVFLHGGAMVCADYSSGQRRMVGRRLSQEEAKKLLTKLE
jgi:hypothetical protein